MEIFFMFFLLDAYYIHFTATVGQQSKEVTMTQYGMKHFLKVPDLTSPKKWKRSAKAMAREFCQETRKLKFRLTQKEYKDKDNNDRISFR